MRESVRGFQVSNQIVDDPEIQLSHWQHWTHRTSIELVRTSPGLYVLAQFSGEAVPIGPADPLAKQVIYIGETCDNSLMGRWQQFAGSAFKGRPGHSGGESYRREIGDQGEGLYVAAMPVKKLDENIRPLFIRYVERKIIWEFAKKWGKAPLCNLK